MCCQKGQQKGTGGTQHPLYGCNESLREEEKCASKMTGWHQTETVLNLLKGRSEFGMILNNWRNGLRSARCNSVRSKAGCRIRDIKGFVSSKNDRQRSVQGPSVCLKTPSCHICAELHRHRLAFGAFWKRLTNTCRRLGCAYLDSLGGHGLNHAGQFKGVKAGSQLLLAVQPYQVCAAICWAPWCSASRVIPAAHGSCLQLWVGSGPGLEGGSLGCHALPGWMVSMSHTACCPAIPWSFKCHVLSAD